MLPPRVAKSLSKLVAGSLYQVSASNRSGSIVRRGTPHVAMRSAKSRIEKPDGFTAEHASHNYLLFRCPSPEVLIVLLDRSTLTGILADLAIRINGEEHGSLTDPQRHTDRRQRRRSAAQRRRADRRQPHPCRRP